MICSLPPTLPFYIHLLFFFFFSPHPLEPFCLGEWRIICDSSLVTSVSGLDCDKARLKIKVMPLLPGFLIEIQCCVLQRGSDCMLPAIPSSLKAWQPENTWGWWSLNFSGSSWRMGMHEAGSRNTLRPGSRPWKPSPHFCIHGRWTRLKGEERLEEWW